MGWGPTRVTGVGALVLVAGGGHAVYPALLGVLARTRPDPSPPAPESWPPLTVVVPAYLEAAVIADKVADLDANGYPGALEILVVADDEATARAAAVGPARILSNERRSGKPAAINLGMACSSTDIVVFTDANTLLTPGSLAALVRWFDDPAVAAVAGEKRVDGAGEATYWRFESWLKRMEFRTGTTVGLVGELYAVRRAAFSAIPEDVPVDDLWIALDALDAGHRIAYEPQAVATEAGSESWRTDWERRTRNTTLIIDALIRRRALLSPRRGLVALQLWGHRMIRSSAGPLAHLTLLGLALAFRRRSRVAALFVAGHGVGAVAAARTVQGRAGSSLERALGQVMFLQAVGVRGVIRYLSRDRSPLWPKAPRPPRTTAPAPVALEERVVS